MGKISFKLGMIFFVFMLLIQMTLFFFLYYGLVETLIEDELKDLRARGNSHRDLLEQNINHFTLNYITLLEAKAETIVVVTDMRGEIIAASDPVKEGIVDILKKHRTVQDREGIIIENSWEDSPYISTISPIIKNKQITGFVYMFLHTNAIKSKIEPLNQYFVLIGFFSLVFTISTIFFLSKLITNPLLKMKKATEKISKGELDIVIPVNGDDELSGLAGSINKLASDLNTMKNARNDFLSSISHELQTPLTYLKGYADVAQRDNIADSDRKNYLRIIQDEAGRVSSLVKNLFDLAKLDQHAFTIEVHEVNLSDIINNVGEKVRTMFLENGMELYIDCPKKLNVYIDSTRFEQVLYNLLDNSRKYSPEGSFVRVKAYESKESINITIADNGYGIPESDLPHIFDRLYRVEQSRSRKTGGHGLGLSIVREVIEAHGGKILAESELGVGTTMKITIPK
ncbi:MAG: two-component sensor histidine kinase [Bacillales bacterium]|nr:two-component sensor histidine kinase [Bacillales bacterium]